MCWHNNRLDESFCIKCCFGNSSKIDWDNIVVNSYGEIEVKGKEMSKKDIVKFTEKDVKNYLDKCI